MPVDDMALASDGASEDDVLTPAQSRRLSDLFDLRSQRPLTDDERAELDALVGAWGRAVSERAFAEVARRRGVPVEQVRAESLAETERVLAWWKEVEADPARREEVVRDARKRQRTRRTNLGNDAFPASADQHARAPLHRAAGSAHAGAPRLRRADARTARESPAPRSRSVVPFSGPRLRTPRGRGGAVGHNG